MREGQQEYCCCLCDTHLRAKLRLWLGQQDVVVLLLLLVGTRGQAPQAQVPLLGEALAHHGSRLLVFPPDDLELLLYLRKRTESCPSCCYVGLLGDLEPQKHESRAREGVVVDFVQMEFGCELLQATGS